MAHLELPLQEGVAEVAHSLGGDLPLGQEPLHVSFSVVDANSWQTFGAQAKVAERLEVGLNPSVNQHEQELGIEIGIGIVLNTDIKLCSNVYSSYTVQYKIGFYASRYF